jgi:hypothetical protein
MSGEGREFSGVERCLNDARRALDALLDGAAPDESCARTAGGV